MRHRNYSFIVHGKGYAPRSHHSAPYKHEIKQIASQNIQNPLPIGNRIDLRLQYLFRELRNRLDGDNLLKTFCDALKGVAYIDDSQIHHHEVAMGLRGHSDNRVLPREPFVITQ